MSCVVPSIANAAYIDCAVGVTIYETEECRFNCDEGYYATENEIVCQGDGSMDNTNPCLPSQYRSLCHFIVDYF